MTSAHATATPKLKLPRIESVRLRRFSLFAANPNAEFTAGNGALCLVGANGIGKSTLLSAINFCLTGTVPDPNRAFVSIDEYYKYTRQYSRNYFRGRITGGDEDDAEITVLFTLGEYQYKIKRGLFEPEELRELMITGPSTNGLDDEVTIGDEIPRLEKHRRYVDSFVKHSGLTSFEEFVFLQLFVFTFDEQRMTLFWNSRIMERVIYRAFGLDPTMALQADSIRREIQHADSRVRNYQWESTRMHKRINKIRSQTQRVAGAQEEYETLVDDHEQLSKQFDEQTKVLRDTGDALKDAHLRLADLSVRETALRDDYSRFFDEQFDARLALTQHPLIVRSLSTRLCGLCGATGADAIARLTTRSQESTCPLCASDVNVAQETQGNAERLQRIDRELATVKNSLRDVHKSIESLRISDAQAKLEWEKTKTKLDEFDRHNSATIEGLRTLLNSGTSDKSLAEYRDQLALLQSDKTAAYERRETLKVQLLALQRELEAHYLQVEEAFVPKFANLAQQFLGMPLSVQLDARETDDVKLVVTVRGTTRRQEQHLSESQRFFLDIALRMALTQHISDSSSLGGMFIDTPEGSLDIAYEKRAGDMLSDFVKAGHQIIMTANLNSSKLLLELAHDCGRPLMQVCKMTEWAALSEVQQEEEGLFEDAYATIDNALDSAEHHGIES